MTASPLAIVREVICAYAPEELQAIEEDETRFNFGFTFPNQEQYPGRAQEFEAAIIWKKDVNSLVLNLILPMYAFDPKLSLEPFFATLNKEISPYVREDFEGHICGVGYRSENVVAWVPGHQSTISCSGLKEAVLKERFLDNLYAHGAISLLLTRDVFAALSTRKQPPVMEERSRMLNLEYGAFQVFAEEVTKDTMSLPRGHHLGFRNCQPSLCQ